MSKPAFSALTIGIAVILATSYSSAELKTSSLNMAKTPFSTQIEKLPEQCQKLFQEGEKLVLEAEKQPGTHTQVKQMKDKLQLSKKTISAMDITMQQKSCDKGLIALNNLKQKY